MRFIMRAILKLLGWRIEGDLPAFNKCVIIFAPHTSNWDFVLMLMTRFCFKMDVAFLGKHTLFKPPLGWFFRWVGGIPVVRSSKNDVVQQVVAEIKNRESIQLALAPEGTRSKTQHWKSGFYHIAVQAGVPIVFTYLDTKTKTIGVGQYIQPTGDIRSDMAKIKDFYKDKAGIRPELASEIQIEDKRQSQ
ncbi:lysophospholipid acyltransferase family protein [Kangiella sediminilitoris]|uniref:lysophospholipid acyltransferase family protein n=1 Tax=Kangiella sediminilitoris TaxID=1144748 RepID=UPI00083CD680|nr:lysophospholipid acyltransferase family protein [Kangiella sediminilitoris]